MVGIDEIELIGGHPALDFANSVENRDAADERNYLPSYEALLAWAVRTGLLDQGESHRLALVARQDKAGAKRVWKSLMRLRRAMHVVFLAIAGREPPPAAALADINREVAQAYGRRHIHLRDGRLRWSWDAAPQELRRVQWLLAEAAAELLTSERTDRIRKCAHAACDWLFLDTSRNGRRRWCRMGVCGNVEKLRRFRSKRKALRKSGR